MYKVEREPTGPGEILNEEFLKPLQITQQQLANHIGCDVKVVNRIVNSRSAVTAAMAIKLASAFNTSPEFWLNAQQAVDIYRASQKIGVGPTPLVQLK